MSLFSLRFLLLPVSILLLQSVTLAQKDSGYLASDGEFMRLVEGGTFKMGATEKEKYLISASVPQHTVTVSDYYISTTEVSLANFKKFIDETGYKTVAEIIDSSYIKTKDDFAFTKGINWRHNEWGYLRDSMFNDFPVFHVSWYDAIEFCNWLSKREGLNPVYTIDRSTIDTCNKSEYDKLKWSVTWNDNLPNPGYRLPTESEWEFAARGGNLSKGYFYSGSDEMSAVAVSENEHLIYKGSYPVAGNTPNELGIYNMSFNVMEWCWDWYADYSSSPKTNPKGAPSGNWRVKRGGAWYGLGFEGKPAYRNGYSSDTTFFCQGFRIAKNRKKN